MAIGGRPIGIVPLVEKTEVSRLGPIRVLTYPLDEWGDQFCPVGASQTAILAMAMRHIAATPRTWDVFEPRWIPTDRIDRGRTQMAMALAGFEPVNITERKSSLIDLHTLENWEAYLATRTKKVRHELRRHLRRVEDPANNLRFVRYRPESFRNGDGDPRWDLYEDCVRVSRASWQAKSETGNTLCDPTVANYLADAHEQAARLGMLDMGLLYHGDRPMAYWYNYHCQGDLFSLRTGYDPAGPSSMGTELLISMVHDSFERGDQSFDFGYGNEVYKKRMQTGVKTSQQLSHIAPTAWRSQALYAARRLKKRFVHEKQPNTIATVNSLS